jgi:hypothetical protein
MKIGRCLLGEYQYPDKTLPPFRKWRSSKICKLWQRAKELLLMLSIFLGVDSINLINDLWHILNYFFLFPFAGLHKQLGAEGCIHQFSKLSIILCLPFTKIVINPISGHKSTNKK